MAPPTEEPLSNMATAQPRSRSGNHSEVALVAPGQLADSPAPSRKRKNAEAAHALRERREAGHRGVEDHADRSPRRVPSRSSSRPETPWPMV